jgi:hypothetical protein
MSAKDGFILECTICFDAFDSANCLKIPRMLSCGHTFCTDCLGNRIQADRSLKCPNCNQSTQSVVLDLIPRDFRFMELLEESHSVHLQCNVPEFPMCQTCENSDHAATHQCVDCEEFTCSAMMQAHTVPKSMRSHRVLPLEEARDFFRKENPFSSALPQKVSCCPLHGEEQLKLYDSTSRKAVCSICVTMPVHKGIVRVLIFLTCRRF